MIFESKRQTVLEFFEYKLVIYYCPYSSAKVQDTITIKAVNGNAIVVLKKSSITDVVQLRLKSFKARVTKHVVQPNY